MTSNRPTQRMAARAYIAQIKGLEVSDRLGDQLAREVESAWDDLLKAIQGAEVHNLPRVNQRVMSIFAPLSHRLVGMTTEKLEHDAIGVYRSTVETAAEVLPLVSLKVAATESRSVREDLAVGLKGYDPLDWSGLTDNELHDLLMSIIFKPLNKRDVMSVVFGGDYVRNMQTLTALGNPKRLADTITSAIHQGKSIGELAKMLRPQVEGVRHVARRIARDEYQRVMHTIKMQTYEQLGDEICPGFTVNAILDERTRPKHRERAGTRYYKNPKAGQKGMDECPQPPRESPRDGNVHAYNCRCLLTALIAVPNAKGNREILLDPDVMSSSFNRAVPSEQLRTVGADRFNAAKERGLPMKWQSFVNAEGRLLTPDELLNI